MRILHLATEAAPFAKAGGLADVVQGLTDELASSGTDARVLLPDYRLDDNDKPRVSVSDWQSIELGRRRVDYRFRQWPPGNGKAPYYLLDCPELFDYGSVYPGGADELLRYVLLCRSAALLCEALDWRPEILHCHDWHVSLLVARCAAGLERDGALGEAKTVLTIHNIGYQGIVTADSLGDCGEGHLASTLPREPDGQTVNLLRAGVRGADAVTTVSPNYAQEILTPQFGLGLEPDLKARAGDLTGILNGADYSIWNPSLDTLIASRYDATNLDGKRACRDALRERLGMQVPQSIPIAGIVSRLVEHKGIDLVLAALPEFIEQHRLALAILGDGDPQLAQGLNQLADHFPDRVGFAQGYDDPLAHGIMAGADLLLVPSRYEPCGLTQMYALKYGTVPVVRKTGGLADTVTHFDRESGTGNGSVFLDADPNGLRWAVDTALGWYADQDAWRQLQQNGFSADFSWPRQAGEYTAFYAGLAGG
jgi:starch synthase